jgi:hypothetical protein
MDCPSSVVPSQGNIGDALNYVSTQPTGAPYMDWLRRVTNVPATETQTGLVLAVCIFTMSLMSIALVWQAQVIAKQNAVIRMLETRFGS